MIKCTFLLLRKHWSCLSLLYIKGGLLSWIWVPIPSSARRYTTSTDYLQYIWVQCCRYCSLLVIMKQQYYKVLSHCIMCTLTQCVMFVTIFFLLGVSDMQLEETFARTTGDLLLPDVRDWVVVIVTAMVSATKFFVQLPLGAGSPFSTGSVPGNNVQTY